MFERKNFMQFGEKIALIAEDGSKYSYRDILYIADLISENIQARSLVFCLTQNSPGSITGYLSFVQNGIVPLMLNSDMDSELLDNLITTYRPEYLWIPKKEKSTNNTGKILLDVLDYFLIKMPFKKEYLLHDELGLLLTTSGSTGSPKLVKLSYENILSNAESISKYFLLNLNNVSSYLPIYNSFKI